MKHTVVIILILLLAFGGYYIYKHRHSTPISTTTKTYRNTEIGISFTYPKTLSASTTDDMVILHHSVPFEHHDYCDFKGEGTTTIADLTDFNVKMHIDELGLVDAMKKESPYIPQENFVNGQVVPSPGFIDTYTVGSLSGYKIFEGAEGCGQTIYYFPINDSRTLVVQQELITIFSGAIDPAQGAQALQVPGVISKDQNEALFEDILKTVKF